jgi:hypothetical protein
MNGNIVRNLLIVVLTEIDSPAVSPKLSRENGNFLGLSLILPTCCAKSRKTSPTTVGSSSFGLLNNAQYSSFSATNLPDLLVSEIWKSWFCFDAMIVCPSRSFGAILALLKSPAESSSEREY